MDKFDYSNRGLLDADVSEIGRTSPAITGGTVSVSLTGPDHPDQLGPNVTVVLAVDTENGDTLIDIEQKLLKATLGVFRRLISETPETLMKRVEATLAH